MAGRRTHRSLSRSRRLEPLESRMLMAGDVKVAADVDTRDIVISADDASNQILVEEIAADRIRVTGLDGTRVNGRTTPVTVTVRDDLTINMAGGNDRVTLRNLNQDNFDHSDVNINMGSGGDTLEIIALDIARHLNVQAGDGNDSIKVSETNAGDMVIDGEYGYDGILVKQSSTRSDLSLDGGEDTDDVRIIDSSIGDDLYVDGDTGNDVLVVSDVDVRDNIRVDGGSGNEAVYVQSSEADDIFVYGRAGRDEVTVRQNRVFDQLFVSLSTGDDDLHFSGNQVGRHYFDGGTGTDHWHSLEFWVTFSGFYNFE